MKKRKEERAIALLRMQFRKDLICLSWVGGRGKGEKVLSPKKSRLTSGRSCHLEEGKGGSMKARFAESSTLFQFRGRIC